MHKALAVVIALLYAFPATSESYECLMSPWRTVDIGSPSSGLIETIEVDRGDRVELGQVVARLDSEVEKASADLAMRRAEATATIDLNMARYEYEKSNLGRRQELHARGVLPEQELVEAEASAMIAGLSVEEAREAQAIARLEAERSLALLERRVIRSPLSGVVMSVEKSPGEFLGQGDSLVRVAVTNPIKVEAYLPLDILGHIVQGQKAQIEAQQPVGGVFDAVLDVIDEVVDARSGTVSVRLRLDNPDDRTLAGLNCVLQFR